MQRFDGFFGGGVFCQGDKITHHDAAGGVIPITQQIFDLLRLILFHFFQDGIRFFFRQTLQQIRHIVVGHLLEDVNKVIQLNSFNEVQEGIGVQFAE